MYPKIIDVLNRLKSKVEHNVYLSTNAHLFNMDIANAVLKNRIDIVNFSIGAATGEFYSIIRGNNFSKVINNIISFIELNDKIGSNTKIQVQIINLKSYKNMNKEIELFKEFWQNYNVSIAIWEELTWGEFHDKSKIAYRYPCLSLWNTLEINSDGSVSVCCMDWKHQLTIGSINNNTIYNLFSSEEIRRLRSIHLIDSGNSIDACRKCNYWHWQDRLKHYPI